MQSCHDVRQQGRGRGPLLRPGRAARASAGIAVLLAVLWAVPAQAGTAGSDRLLPGGTLQAGQSISAGGDTLIMRANGNLVLYAPGRTQIWSSRTSGHRGARLVMRNDGDLVVVTPGGTPLWAAGTGRHGGSMLILQPDGNAVIYAPGDVALWSTNTSRQTYAVTQLTAHGWAAPVRLPQPHLGPGERLERASRPPGVLVRDPAGQPGQQDGRCGT